MTNTLPVGNGGTGTATAFTQGSVIVAGASGVYTQDNANFFWDGTNHRLGIGTTSPSDPIQIANPSGKGINGSGPNFTIGSTTNNFILTALNNFYVRPGSGYWTNFDTGLGVQFQVGDVLIGGTTDGNYRLDVQKSGSTGTARFFDQTATTGATRVQISLGAADAATTATYITQALRKAWEHSRIFTE